MPKIAVGDIVGRKSYGMDVYFKVREIADLPGGGRRALLCGLDVRLCCDAPLEDLEKVGSDKVAAYWRQVMLKSGEMIRRSFERRGKDESLVHSRQAVGDIETFELPGRVLHLDADSDYMDLCAATYRQLGVPHNAYHIPEDQQPTRVTALLKKHSPDILVITGHDAYQKEKKDFKSLNSYRSSRYFVQAVIEARKYEHSRDDLVIFAGACQSHYEALLGAGANFASSPERVLIHTFDPVFIVERVAFTPVHQPVELRAIIEATITGYPGIGGLDTRGKFRMGAPKSAY